jgi:hypothetical protein
MKSGLMTCDCSGSGGLTVGVPPTESDQVPVNKSSDSGGAAVLLRFAVVTAPLRHEGGLTEPGRVKKLVLQHRSFSNKTPALGKKSAEYKNLNI